MTDVKDMPGHWVRRFQQIAVAVFHSEVGREGFDLTPVQYAALSTLNKNEGIDQATLAGLIAYDRTTIAGVVDRLVQKDFLSRAVSDTDRRARVLRMTEKGRTALADIEPAVLRTQDIMMSGLTEPERTEFMRLIRKATEAVNDLSRAPLRPKDES